MAFLKVFSSGEERTVFLGGEPVILGRGDDTQILLKDLKASRHHCVIEPAAGERWQVRDLDSGNGTKVNGDRIHVHVLRPDDVIQVGDAKVVFASEAAAVVAPKQEAPPKKRGKRRSRSPLLVLGAVLLVGIGTLAIVWSSIGREKGDGPGEDAAYRLVMSAPGDHEVVRLAEAYRLQYLGSRRAAEVEAAAGDARRRIAQGEEREKDLYDPSPDVQGLSTVRAVRELERLLDAAPREKEAGIRAALGRFRQRLADERKLLFDDLLEVFERHVSEGEYSRAREIWFFLRGDEAWEPIPDAYSPRIVDAMTRLENAATAERARLFQEIDRLEAAHEFGGAREMLQRQLPQFAGTSVLRSLQERIAFLDRALAEGVTGSPTQPRTTVRVDVEKRMEGLLLGLARREFAEAAQALRELAEQSRKDKGYAELAARAGEAEAAAALHAALVAALEAGSVPGGQIHSRWRVLEGGAQGIKVRTKGQELLYPWLEVPPPLYLALLEKYAAGVERGYLGLAVVAHAVAGEAELASALATAYEKERQRSVVDAFVAARIRKEAVPEGGYVVHAGEILSRKEHLRRVEESLIQGYKEQLEKSFQLIKNDNAWGRLEKLRKKKGQLDEARRYALELIFDEKKYFYPYRGTGREGEYNKVQQDVDQRVKAVEEIWEDKMVVSVKATAELGRALKQFDEAAAELEKRLVDVEEKVEEVAFLRSYLGGKFDVRTLYRDPREKELLDYSLEVMEFNPTVTGDIKDNERQQVEVTNLYRMMFGRWPVRLVEKLVLSSRGHCEEMTRLGYFGHFSPTPGRRTPYDRMKLQGYVYGSSENCVAGTTDPKGSHERWCHSSGHHRNILMPPWTEMGTGAGGSMMTQNFGQAPKWSKHDEKKDVTYDPVDDYDDEEDPCGETRIEEGQFDYEDEEE